MLILSERAVIWWSSTLVYEVVRLHSISMQPQHTSWKLACACVCVCLSEHEAQREWREITDKGINRKMEVSVTCSSSQHLTNKAFLVWCSPWLPAVSCTHAHTVTDVTRIQEGVAAYYILRAHTGCLAWLGLLKRLRLDKQRGLCLCSLLISSHLFLCLRHIWVLLCT